MIHLILKIYTDNDFKDYDNYDVILYDDIQINDTINSVNFLDDNVHNYLNFDQPMTITLKMLIYINYEQNIKTFNNICDPKRNSIIGFIDPKSNKIFLNVILNFITEKN